MSLSHLRSINLNSIRKSRILSYFCLLLHVNNYLRDKGDALMLDIQKTLKSIKRRFYDEIKKRSKLAVISATVLVLVLTLSIAFLYPVSPIHEGSRTGVYTPHEQLIIYGQDIFTANVSEINVISGEVPQYTLPISIDDVSNNEYLKNLGLSDEALDILSRNGFVVIFLDVGDKETLTDFAKYYQDLPEGFPRFVTADMMLHTYHALYASLLMYYEITYFIPWLNTSFKALLSNSIMCYMENQTNSAIVNEAMLRTIAYILVPLWLLDPNYTLPTNIPNKAVNLAEQELANIYAHDDFKISPILMHLEDYTQYIPRGYYTFSEPLKRYFRATMYLGRMFFPVYDSMNQTVADVSTVMAVLLTKLVLSTEFEFNGSTISVFSIYKRIYHITSFFVGFSDDLTFYDYINATSQVFGEQVSTSQLGDIEKIHTLQELLIERDHSKISTVGEPKKIAEIGLRFLGQRFILDSYIFQKLVYPEVPTRFMPTSLDVPAVFGSSRARQHLSDTINNTSGYKEKLDELSETIKNMSTSEWTKNLYNGWLYTINATLRDHYVGYPTFMQTEAWLDQKLVTFLGSWTELRHDTILYAKQSYTLRTSIPSVPGGYVEPIPLLWSRLRGLTIQTKMGLSKLGVLTQFYEEKLDSLSEELYFLLNASLKELKNEKLSETETMRIYSFGEWLESLMSGIEQVHQKTTIVADVHTDPNSNTVLEEGVGYIHLLIAVYPTPDGRLEFVLGPVFSYYEFTESISNRLTDESWAQILDTGAVQLPSWTSSYLVP